MTESELLGEVARRSGVSRPHVEAVLAVLAEIRHEERRKREMAAPAVDAGAQVAYTPSYTPGADEVQRLIGAATAHPLGLEFLLEGNLCAVATMFGVHAFTVDAARQRLKEQAV